MKWRIYSLAITGRILKTSIYHFKDYKIGIMRNFRPLIHNLNELQFLSNDIITIFEYNKKDRQYVNKKVFQFPTRITNNSQIEKSRGILETRSCFIFVEVIVKSKEIGRIPSMCLRHVNKRNKKILVARNKPFGFKNLKKSSGEEASIDSKILKNLADYGEQYFEFFSSFEISDFETSEKIKIKLLSQILRTDEKIKNFLLLDCLHFRILKSSFGVFILTVTEKKIKFFDRNFKGEFLFFEAEKDQRIESKGIKVRVFGNNWNIVGVRFKLSQNRTMKPGKLLFFNLERFGCLI